MTASFERVAVAVAVARERENCLLAALMGRTRRAACIREEEEVREGSKVCELKNGTRRSGCLSSKKPLLPIGSPSDLLTQSALSSGLGSNVTSDNSLSYKGIHHAQDIIEKKQGTRRAAEGQRGRRSCLGRTLVGAVTRDMSVKGP